MSVNCFNPRAREGRDRLQSPAGGQEDGFNPRAREGRDAGELVLSSLHLVSIHAPARGATDMPAVIALYHPVSIHAPARGATR